MKADELFNGLKIIELSTVLAGPLAGTFFSELGAHVIKMEPKATGGDVTRNWKLGSEDPKKPISAYYASANYKKEVRLIDLGDPMDREELFKKLEDADILISNFLKGKLEELDLDDKDLRTRFPKLIHGKINGFGADSDRPAYDVVLQAESGFMLMNGEPGRPPVKMPVALIDVLAAHQLKEGLLVGLLQRGQTGEGCIVEVSLLQAAISSLVNQATNWLMANHVPQALGTLHPNIAPYGEMFLTKDGKWIVLAVGSNKQFEQLCSILGMPNLAQREQFDSNPSRVKNRQKLSELFAPVFQSHDRNHWMEKFIELGVPAGSLLDMKEVFEQPQAKEMLRRQLVEGVETIRPSSIAFQIK